MHCISLKIQTSTIVELNNPLLIVVLPFSSQALGTVILHSHTAYSKAGLTTTALMSAHALAAGAHRSANQWFSSLEALQLYRQAS